MPLAGGLAAATSLTVGGMTWFQSPQLAEHAKILTSPDGHAASFQCTHMAEIEMQMTSPPILGNVYVGLSKWF